MEPYLKLGDNVWAVRNLAGLLDLLKNELTVSIESLRQLNFDNGPLALTVTPHPQEELGPIITAQSLATYIGKSQEQLARAIEFSTGIKMPTVPPRMSIGWKEVDNIPRLPVAQSSNSEQVLSISAVFKWWVEGGHAKYLLQNTVTCNGHEFAIDDYQLVVNDSNGLPCHFHRPRRFLDLGPPQEWLQLDFIRNEVNDTFYINGVATP